MYCGEIIDRQQSGEAESGGDRIARYARLSGVHSQPVGFESLR